MTSELLRRDLLPGDGGRVLCAVSGGLDSMCLLSLCREAGYDTACAHYDHSLRPDSGMDAAFVADWCAARGIPFYTEREDVAALARAWGLGTEAAARRARYAFLERAADALHCAVIATAHTADDQAETMLLQLCRGAGSRGLSGIPPRRGRVVRPLLAVPRRELERYARETGIPHREDPTNAGDSFARNRLRHHVLPVLETVNPAFLGNFGRCAARLAEDDACLYAQAEAFLEANPSLPADRLLALPEAVRGRVYRLAAGRSLEWAHVPILDDLCRGGNGRRVNLPEGDAAEKHSGCLRFFFAGTPAGIVPVTLYPGFRGHLDGPALDVHCEICPSGAEIHNSFNTFFFSCENIYGSMTLRARMPGDRLRPVGRNCVKSVKKLLSEAGVPPERRDSIPVLADEKGVLAVYGFPQDERAVARPGEACMAVSFTPGTGRV